MGQCIIVRRGGGSSTLSLLVNGDNTQSLTISGVNFKATKAIGFGYKDSIDRSTIFAFDVTDGYAFGLNGAANLVRLTIHLLQNGSTVTITADPTGDTEPIVFSSQLSYHIILMA